MEKNLTTGSVGRQLIGFSLPYLLSYLLQTLYGMADLFIIGQYAGVAGTTAVAVGSQVMHMLTVMIVGLAMGTTVSIARAIGADDRPQAAAATGNTVTLFLSLSLVLTAGLLLLRRPITAVGIVEKIIGFLFLVPSSMLSAVSALGAQNLGAGKPERAKQTLFWAIGLACGFGAVTVVAVQFLAEALVGLFTPDQAAVLAGGQYLRGDIWDSFFAGVQFSFSGYFCACGRSRLFPQTLLPMGLANAAGSLFSICARWICPCRLFWLGQTLRITDCSHLQSPERYRRLMDYIRANGLQPDGFSREITLIDYGLTNDTEKFVTEITIPVREA